MSNLQKLASDLADLRRIRQNLMTYSHPDDLSAEIAKALRSIAGSDQKEAIVALLVDGLDAAISVTKNKIRDELE